MHKSLYKPGCLTSLLRWDLLEQQNAEVKHKKGKLERGVKEDQLIEILSLTLTQIGKNNVISPEIMEILNEEHVGVWVSGMPSRANNAALIS